MPLNSAAARSEVARGQETRADGVSENHSEATTALAQQHGDLLAEHVAQIEQLQLDKSALRKEVVALTGQLRQADAAAAVLAGSRRELEVEPVALRHAAAHQQQASQKVAAANAAEQDNETLRAELAAVSEQLEQADAAAGALLRARDEEHKEELARLRAAHVTEVARVQVGAPLLLPPRKRHNTIMRAATLDLFAESNNADYRRRCGLKQPS